MSETQWSSRLLGSRHSDDVLFAETFRHLASCYLQANFAMQWLTESWRATSALDVIK